MLTREEQARRAWQQLQAQGDDLAGNVYLEQLHDRNEVLYYRVLADHLAELLPVVYDPTVGDTIERYSDEYRRPRGSACPSARRTATCPPGGSTWSGPWPAR